MYATVTQTRTMSDFDSPNAIAQSPLAYIDDCSFPLCSLLSSGSLMQ